MALLGALALHTGLQFDVYAEDVVLNPVRGGGLQRLEQFGFGAFLVVALLELGECAEKGGVGLLVLLVGWAFGPIHALFFELEMRYHIGRQELQQLVTRCLCGRGALEKLFEVVDFLDEHAVLGIHQGRASRKLFTPL